MSKNKYYIGLAIIVIIFGILVIPRIIDRFSNSEMVESNRLHQPTEQQLAYVTLNGQKRKVPEFLFRNQDSMLISNEDYKGKVYIAEFFFTTCPTICPIMNKNLVSIQNEFSKWV